LAATSARSYTFIAIAIVIAGILIAASLFVAVGTPTKTTTITSTATSVSTTTQAEGSSRLYQVEFSQESNCPYGVWVVPWAVVLNNQTIVQPSNATLPLLRSTNGTSDDFDINYSAIWFSLPNGTYSYTIFPKNFYGQEQSGNVTIDRSDVVVQVSAFITAMGCSSTAATTSVSG